MKFYQMKRRENNYLYIHTGHEPVLLERAPASGPLPTPGDAWPVILRGVSLNCNVRGAFCERRDSPFFNIEFVTAGTYHYEDERNCCDLHAGTMYLLCPELHTRFSCISPTAERRLFMFTGNMLSPLLKSMHLDSFFACPEADHAVWDRFYRTGRELLNRPQTQEQLMESGALAMQLLMECAVLRKRETLPENLLLAQEYLRRNLTEPVTLAELCRASHCSSATLYRLFHQHLRQEPMRCFAEMRLEYAAELLLHENASIKEIAARMHFSSPQYFAGAFLRHFGESPRDYRARRIVWPKNGSKP